MEKGREEKNKDWDGKEKGEGQLSLSFFRGG